MARDGIRKITRTTTAGTHTYFEARATIDGKQRSWSAPTEGEARARRKAALNLAERGIDLDAGRTPLRDYLQHWLETYVEPNKAAHTYRDYADIVKLHISPHPIARLPLEKLTAPQCQGFVNDMAKKKKRGGEKLSARRVQYIRAVLRAGLSRAKRDRLIAENPARDLDMPKLRRKKVEGLSEEQEQAILDAFQGHEFEALVTTIVTLGLRRGEALGLSWSDLDLDARAVVINGRKSDTSQRRLRLPLTLVDVLRRHRAQSRWAFNPTTPVFVSSTGTPLDGRNVYRRFQARLREKDVPHMRLHDLRHGAASLLLSEGADLFVVKEMLGHSQIALTADLYGHLSDSGKLAIADRIDARRQRASS